MILLKKLHSNPQIFQPILFEKGINIILGEKVNENTSANRKTNGVGKSMCIEFIDFCLLKQDTWSRVMQIPDDTLPSDTQIILDLEIMKQEISIIRTKSSPDRPIIIQNNEFQEFRSLDDAKEYLTRLILPTDIEISFRELISPLIRDERSEFRDIILCNDLKRRIPPNHIPHLYYFNIDINLYEEIKKSIDELEKTNNFLSKVKELLKLRGTSKERIQIEINNLKGEVDAINKSVEELQNLKAFDVIQKDIIVLEDQLDVLRAQQKSIKYELTKINSFPQMEQITETDIEIIYNQFKQGLGNLVAKTIDEVQAFKLKIDKFQKTLLNDKATLLEKKLEEIGKKIKNLDEILQTKQQTLDVNGNLRQLKSSIAIMNKKSEEYQQKVAIYNDLKQTENSKKDANQHKNNLIDEKLRKELESIEQKIKDFENTILDAHYTIMGNRKASFDIKEVNKKNTKYFIEFNLRIDTDGSHSIDRVKVFIYDIALILNEHTRVRHPKFLIHDNIFDVDQDTLVQSLNFLHKIQQEHPDFQYILTLNRDKIENEERKKEINFDLDNVCRARFTKEKKFLNSNYEETGK
ncbi:MAG: DUF2326 domain-containing protein [Bacteroidetes bacterium]|nr:MAG: DUF2326 domain-containing protein [Bacteroidota bacterium]